MAFFVGKPERAMAPPPQPPPPPHGYPYYNQPQMAQYAGYYQPPELITKLYHKLSVIDYDMRCPVDLIHLIVKAAMRDPAIAHDIDVLVSQRSQEFRPSPQQLVQSQQSQQPQHPQHPQHPQAYQGGPPPGGSHPQAMAAAPSLPAQETQGPQPGSANPQGQAQAPIQASSSALAPAQRIEGQEQVQSPNSSASSYETASGGRDDESPGQQGAPKGKEVNHNGAAVDLTGDDGPSTEPAEPKEKPVDFSKLLGVVETDLGLREAQDDNSNHSQAASGREASFKINKMLARLCGFMDANISFPNRLHILTVMRDILLAVLRAKDLPVGRDVQNRVAGADTNFLRAVEKLTDRQKRQLKEQDDEKWIKAMQELVRIANEDAVFPQLQNTLVVIDPNTTLASSGGPHKG